MITSVSLRNFGPLKNIEWGNLANINVVLGGNGVGKTFLLKAMYVAINSAEQHMRGNDRRTISEIVADKLYWTFQTEKIGDVVNKNEDAPLMFKLKTDDGGIEFSFGQDTTRKISVTSSIQPTETNSVFIPAKEVVSLQNIILKSRDIDKVFGFDDTYYDLAKVLSTTTGKGRNYSAFAASRKSLKKFLGGKVEYDRGRDRWIFKKGNTIFPIGITSEGVKKISILDTLLGNRYLSPGSKIFIDEPESALHPQGISQFMDIISTLAKCGIQFFIATHSYTVIENLYILGLKKRPERVPTLSFGVEGMEYFDLVDGIYDTGILEEYGRLYHEEMRAALQ